MIILMRRIALLFVGLMMVSCSSTEMTGSWSHPDFKGKVEKVYIVGLAKNELNRRIFEDTFSNVLHNQGVPTVTSYGDFADILELDRDVVARKMTEHGCDSVLITKLIGQSKETVTNPARVSGYSSGPYYGRRGGRNSYYNNWGSYYQRSYDVVYEPATTTEFIILTVESVMYDLKTEELIWSAQFETFVEKDIVKMTQDYVKAATMDLKAKGLI